MISHANQNDVDCPELELSPAHERRQWRRFTCNLHALCRVMKAPLFPIFEGTIVNLSLHGAAIWVGQDLGRGTRISARLFNATDEFQCDRLGRVIHVRPITGGWMIGCEFAESLSKDQFHTLLG